MSKRWWKQEVDNVSRRDRAIYRRYTTSALSHRKREYDGGREEKMSEARGGVEKGANCFACREKRVSLAGYQQV